MFESVLTLNFNIVRMALNGTLSTRRNVLFVEKRSEQFFVQICLNLLKKEHFIINTSPDVTVIHGR